MKKILISGKIFSKQPAFNCSLKLCTFLGKDVFIQCMNVIHNDQKRVFTISIFLNAYIIFNHIVFMYI